MLFICVSEGFFSVLRQIDCLIGLSGSESISISVGGDKCDPLALHIIVLFRLDLNFLTDLLPFRNFTELTFDLDCVSKEFLKSFGGLKYVKFDELASTCF